MRRNYSIHLLFVIGFLSLLLIQGCSNTKNGRLPKDFSWAYGKWNITDISPVYDYGHGFWDITNIQEQMEKRKKIIGEKKENYDIIIGEDYVQYLEHRVEVKNTYESYDNDPSAELLFPYVECAYKLKLNVFFGNPNEDYELEPEECSGDAPTDEIAIYYQNPHSDIIEGCYLFLNRKNKTISKFSQEELQEMGYSTAIKKVRTNKNVFQHYKEAVYACPFIGDWVNARNRRDKESVTSDVVFESIRPLKSGEWRSYDNIYSYNQATDELTLIPTDDGETKIYRRYDEEKERLEEKREREILIKSSLTQKYFSCMTNSVYTNETYQHVYSFEQDGTGSVSFYKVEPYGKTLIDRRSIQWNIEEDGDLRVYDKEATSGYDSFKIKENIIGGVFIEDMSGNVYN